MMLTIVPCHVDAMVVVPSSGGPLVGVPVGAPWVVMLGTNNNNSYQFMVLVASTRYQGPSSTMVTNQLRPNAGRR
jgi:hypothetical protein